MRSFKDKLYCTISYPTDKPLPEDIKSQLEPYLLDAGLDPNNQDRKFLVQGLMLYNIINKRRLEVEDICKGIYRVMIHCSVAVFYNCLTH